MLLPITTKVDATASTIFFAGIYFGAIYDLLLRLYAIGLLGVLMRRFDFPTAPVALGMILGPLAEAQLSNVLSIGGGRWGVFLERPMSVTLLAITLAVLVRPRVIRIWKARA